MDLIKVYLWMIGAVAVLFGIGWLVHFLDRKITVKKFDERQQIGRDKGYRFAFWVGMLYFLALFCLLSFGCLKDYVLEAVMGGLLLQAISCHIYMFFTDSELPFSKKPTLIFAVYFALGFGYLYLAYDEVRIQQFLGITAIPWVKLMLAVTWLTLGLLYFLTWLKGLADE